MLPPAPAHPSEPSLISLLPLLARPQIMRIVQNIRPDRQTVMFSATFPRQVGLCYPLPLVVGKGQGLLRKRGLLCRAGGPLALPLH